MSSSEVFDAIVPRLALDPRADLFLQMAGQSLNAAAFGLLYEQAACYLAAHMIASAPRDEVALGAGPVTSEGAGDLSVGYGTFPASGKLSIGDAELAQTAYGRAFLRIRNSRAAAMPFAVQTGWGP